MTSEICNARDCYYHHGGPAPCSGGRLTTVKAAGPFGGNSQSGRTAQHGTQSGYVMHKRPTCCTACGGDGWLPSLDAPATCPYCQGRGKVTGEACQPCKDAHAAYARDPREHVSGADALHPNCIYGGTEGAPCQGGQS